MVSPFLLLLTMFFCGVYWGWFLTKRQNERLSEHRKTV